MIDDARNSGRRSRRQRVCVFLKDRGDRGRVRVAVERPASRDHLMQQHADRKQIRSRAYGFPSQLLGRHVCDGADHLAGSCDEISRFRVGSRRRIVEAMRNAEVQNLQQAGGRDEEIFRLEVAMDDATAMRRVEAAGDLRSNGGRLACGKRAPLEPFAECGTFEKLEDRVDDVVVPAEIVNGEDIWMRQRSNGSSLALEPREPVWIVNCSGRTFRATSRPRRVSRARYTSPIPPSPSLAMIS